MNSFTLSDVFAAVRGRIPSIVLTGLVVLPLLVVCIMLIPEKYDSQAQLLVRLGRGSVSLDPTTGISNTVSVQESRIAQVNSIKELLASHSLADQVVSKVGAERILEKHSLVESVGETLVGLIPKRTAGSLGDLSADDVADQLQREEAVKAVIKSITISAAKDAYTINLYVRTGSPFLSRDVLDAFVDSYKDYHIKAYQSEGSVDFFEQQTQKAYQRVVKVQDELQQMKSAAGVADLSAAKGALRSTISQVRGEHLGVASELAAVESEITQIQKEMQSTPRQIDSEVLRGIPKKLGDGMRQSLYSLEMQYQDLQSKLKPGNPKLDSIREQIAEARKIADSETGDQPQTLEAVNKVFQQLEISLSSAQVRRSGLVSKQVALQDQLDTLELELVALNEAEVRLTRLEWGFELAETDYLQFAKNRDEALQVASLDARRLSEISVAQDATLGLKKTSPRRSMLAVLALAFTGALALTQAVVRGLLAPPTVSASSHAATRSRGETRHDDSGRRDRVDRPQTSDWDADRPVDDDARVVAASVTANGAASPDHDTDTEDTGRINRPPH